MQETERAAKKGASASAHSIPLSPAMILVTLGVVYGDIGTSPMYTLKAIMTGNGGLPTMAPDVVIGALSLIIWTMTLITTVKYVLIAMKADNRGEGGIFALYSLVRTSSKWLLVPAMVGGAALLADGILTPAVTVTTAIEGLRTIDAIHRVIGDRQSIVVIITILILCALFVVQRAGTSTIGKGFGPIMTLWFAFLATSGLVNLLLWPGVLLALNPLRGIMFLFDHHLNNAGIMVLGKMTGQQALDQGIVEAINFGPYLIVNGEPCSVQGFSESSLNPRTAIGQRADGAFLILTVDGRQPTSIGASYEDLIEIMMRYGAVNAANLDGGSSTYMVQNDPVNNDPRIITQTASLYGPRRMATSILVCRVEDISKNAYN